MRRFPTKEDSDKEFIRIWTTFYGGFPTLAQAIRYTGNDNAARWLTNVKTAYNGICNK